MPVTITPDAFVDRGIFQKGVVQVVSSQYVTFDFNGQAEESTCLRWGMRRQEDAPDSEPFYQYWSVGGGTSRFVPDPESEGNHLVAVGDDEHLTKGSNFHYLLDSLWNAGLPKTFLGQGVKSFVGLVAELDTKPVQRQMRDEPAQEGDRKKGGTVVVCTHIITMPGQKGATPKATPKTTPKGQTPAVAPAQEAPAAAGSDDHDELISYKMMENLANMTIPVSNMSPMLLTDKSLEIPANLKAKAVLGMLKNAEKLANYGITVDGTNLTLG